MATVNLTSMIYVSTPMSTSELFYWSGNQSLIGNLLRWTIPIGWRIVTFLQIQLKGTDTATPGGSGLLSILSQHGEAASEFVVGGRFFSNGASVAAAGATYAWLRGTISPNVLATTGALFRVGAWGDAGTPLNEQNDGVCGSSLIINYECSSLTGVAAATLMRAVVGYRT